MINLFKKIFRFLVGIVFLSLTITISRSFYNQLSNISILNSKNQVYFLWGVVSYVVMHLFFFKPNFIYNMGHDGVHVISTWLSFGRAKDLKVSIFIPIYTVILCVAYFLISKFRDISQYAPYFVFFIGFTLAMHIILTIEALKTIQPDLIKTGYLFSFSLIYVINIIVAAGIISLIFPGFSFVDFFTQFCLETKGLYRLIYTLLF